jgi:hypothetical protein
MARFTHVVVAAALLAALAFGAAACDDEDAPPATGSSNASQESIDQLAARVQRNEMLFATIALSKLGLHAMDDALNADAPAIDPSYSRNTREAVRLLALTNWDTSVEEDAAAVHDHAVELLAALSEEDIAAAGDAATALHEGEHDLSNDVWAIVAKDLPPDAGGVESHDEGAETPAAGETAPADHDEGGETPEATP